MQRAIAQLDEQPTHLLIDAMKLDNDIPQTSIIKGDAKSVSIAAASIMAKEYRDDYMKALAMHFQLVESFVLNNLNFDLIAKIWSFSLQ